MILLQILGYLCIFGGVMAAFFAGAFSGAIAMFDEISPENAPDTVLTMMRYSETRIAKTLVISCVLLITGLVLLL